jgi:hypothetical protein
MLPLPSKCSASHYSAHFLSSLSFLKLHGILRCEALYYKIADSIPDEVIEFFN